MKYLKFIFPIVFISLLGCSTDREDEHNLILNSTPNYVEVAIDVVDADYNNLFSYKYSGSIDISDIENSLTYTYKGVTYPVYIFEPKSSNGTSYLPHSCLYIDYHVASYNGIPRMRFGMFDGTKDWSESVIINWPDGTNNKIEFTSKADNSYSSMMTRIDEGEWCNTRYVTFIK